MLDPEVQLERPKTHCNHCGSAAKLRDLKSAKLSLLLQRFSRRFLAWTDKHIVTLIDCACLTRIETYVPNPALPSEFTQLFQLGPADFLFLSKEATGLVSFPEGKGGAEFSSLSAMPRPRDGFICVPTKNTVYTIGPTCSDRFDVRTNVWHRLPDLPTKIEMPAGAAVISERYICVFTIATTRVDKKVSVTVIVLDLCEQDAGWKKLNDRDRTGLEKKAPELAYIIAEEICGSKDSYYYAWANRGNPAADTSVFALWYGVLHRLQYDKELLAHHSMLTGQTRKQDWISVLKWLPRDNT